MSKEIYNYYKYYHPNHLDISVSAMYMGYVLVKQQDYLNAEKELQFSLDSQIKLYGTTNYSQIIVAYIYLAEAQYYLGKYRDAEETLKNAGESFKNYYGADTLHLDKVRIKLWLGNIYAVYQNFSGAKRQYEKAENLLKRFERDNSDMVVVIEQLRENIEYQCGRLYYIEGQDKVAIEYFLNILSHIKMIHREANDLVA